MGQGETKLIRETIPSSTPGRKQHFQRPEPEGATVKRWRQRHDHVQDGHGGQEEDEQQHAQVEVIRSGSFEDPGLRDVATHHGPALEVHGCVESKDIDAWEAGGEEGAHPGKTNVPLLSPSLLFVRNRVTQHLLTSHRV